MATTFDTFVFESVILMSLACCAVAFCLIVSL